jgi:hypothetical protein
MLSPAITEDQGLLSAKGCVENAKPLGLTGRATKYLAALTLKLREVVASNYFLTVPQGVDQRWMQAEFP